MTTTIVQTAHFFDRLPAKENAAAAFRRVYVFRNDTTGRYFLANTAAVDGATRVYFRDRDDYPGHVSLDTETEDSERTATLYGDDRVKL